MAVHEKVTLIFNYMSLCNNLLWQEMLQHTLLMTYLDLLSHCNNSGYYLIVSPIDSLILKINSS